MSDAATRSPKHPPPWFVHTGWRVHRALYRLSGGRFVWTTSNKRGWGSLHLTTIGRKSGQSTDRPRMFVLPIAKTGQLCEGVKVLKLRAPWASGLDEVQLARVDDARAVSAPPIAGSGAPSGADRSTVLASGGAHRLWE